jgi:prophage regulatory protein
MSYDVTSNGAVPLCLRDGAGDGRLDGHARSLSVWALVAKVAAWAAERGGRGWKLTGVTRTELVPASRAQPSKIEKLGAPNRAVLDLLGRDNSCISTVPSMATAVDGGGGRLEVCSGESAARLFQSPGEGRMVCFMMTTETTDTTNTALREMLSVKQVLKIVPFSRATLYREMDAGRFPPAHEIAPRRIAWFADDVKVWQAGIKTVV